MTRSGFRMKNLLLISSTVFVSLTFGQAEIHRQAVSALGWYIEWATSDGRFETQNCAGVHTRDSYVLICSPLRVTMRINQAESGKCTVQLLRADFGLGDSAFADIRPSKHAKTGRCDGLPVEDGTFSIQLHPRSLPINQALTSRARLSAIRYLDAWDEVCTAKFPLVRDLDPFFHVYVTCKNAYTVVLEFLVVDGIPDSFSNIDYSNRRRNLPQGHQDGSKNEKIWFSSQKVGRQKK